MARLIASKLAGRVQEWTDALGNKRFTATSDYPSVKPVTFWSRGGAEFYLWVTGERLGSLQVRGQGTAQEAA